VKENVLIQQFSNLLKYRYLGLNTRDSEVEPDINGFLFCFVETGSQYIAQANLELLVFLLSFPNVEIIGVYHHAWLQLILYIRDFPLFGPPNLREQALFSLLCHKTYKE
jgi:hypothetical protein